MIHVVFKNRNLNPKKPPKANNEKESVILTKKTTANECDSLIHIYGIEAIPHIIRRTISLTMLYVHFVLFHFVSFVMLIEAIRLTSSLSSELSSFEKLNWNQFSLTSLNMYRSSILTAITQKKLGRKKAKRRKDVS